MSKLFAEDGYRYGVMDRDGFVVDNWNGIHQRLHAETFAAECMAQWPGDNITLCRRRPYGKWERI